VKVFFILILISIAFSLSVALARTKQDRSSHREEKLRHELKKNLHNKENP
jgi:hypothetical protein